MESHIYSLIKVDRYIIAYNMVISNTYVCRYVCTAYYPFILQKRPPLVKPEFCSPFDSDSAIISS